MEQILLANGPLKEIVTAKMMLYNNRIVKVRSSDGNTDILLLLLLLEFGKGIHLHEFSMMESLKGWSATS